jgi:enoyl-[acyl-carrier protein] reductase III
VNALITGGSKGIGRALALRLAPAGGTVFVNYHSDDASADATVRDVAERGGKAIAVKVDVSTPAGCRQLLEEVRATVDTLDLLVHGAVTSVTGPTLELDPTDFARAVELNGSALLYVTQAALPLLKRGSTVLFLSSKGSIAAVPNYAALGAPKAMAEALVRYLAVELAPQGVRVNTVSAGPLDTDAFRSMFPTGADERLAAAAAANPSGRGLEIDDVLGLIEFLASDAAAMIQGQRLHVDGGLYLR